MDKFGKAALAISLQNKNNVTSTLTNASLLTLFLLNTLTAS
jgi:hypothetical protein